VLCPMRVRNAGEEQAERSSSAIRSWWNLIRSFRGFAALVGSADTGEGPGSPFPGESWAVIEALLASFAFRVGRDALGIETWVCSG
jgi:hypothetical protein